MPTKMPRKADLCRGQIFVHGFMLFSSGKCIFNKCFPLHLWNYPTFTNSQQRYGAESNHFQLTRIWQWRIWYGPRDPTPFRLIRFEELGTPSAKFSKQWNIYQIHIMSYATISENKRHHQKTWTITHKIHVWYILPLFTNIWLILYGTCR